MTERERLIQLISTAGCNIFSDTQAKEQLTDYLLANGVIVPPCKVGDTIYVKFKKEVYPVFVYAVRVDTKKNDKRICVSGTFELAMSYKHDYNATFKWESIGKSVFLTREAAEKALGIK